MENTSGSGLNVQQFLAASIALQGTSHTILARRNARWCSWSVYDEAIADGSFAKIVLVKDRSQDIVPPNIDVWQILKRLPQVGEHHRTRLVNTRPTQCEAELGKLLI